MSQEELAERMFCALEDATIFGAYLNGISDEDIRAIRTIMQKLEKLEQ